METKQVLCGPWTPVREELKSERVQGSQPGAAGSGLGQEPPALEPSSPAEPFGPGGLRIRVQAERIQPSLPPGEEEDAIYIYEFAVSQRQPVTMALPLVTVTFHGYPAWGGPGGQTGDAPAAARRLG